MRKLHFAFSALRLVFPLLTHKVVQPLFIKQPAETRPAVEELDEEENAVRSTANSAEIGAPLENFRLLVYRTEPCQLGSVHSFFVNKRNPFLSLMMTGRQSKKRQETALMEKE